MYGLGFTVRSERYTWKVSMPVDDIEPLRKHRLKDVARGDVLLGALDCGKIVPSCWCGA